MSEKIERKQKFTGKVIKITLAGAVVDIGVGKPGIIHISKLSAEPVKNVEDVVQVGQEIAVWVHRAKEGANHIELTMIEPLGLDWGQIKKGLRVKGMVTRIEKYGAFIEIGAERPGLAHISELTHNYIRNTEEAVKIGDEVEVVVLEFSRRKKQIKLSLKAAQEPLTPEIEEIEEEEDQEEALTAMEIAYKKAMGELEEGFGSDDRSTSKSAKNKTDQEDILTRTLANKPE